MGTKQIADVDGDLLSGSEEEFQALDSAPSAPAPTPDIEDDPAEIERSGFAPADEEHLSHLGPGCFVLVLTDGSFCWAEVVSVEGEWVSGQLHNELSTSPCQSQQSTPGTGAGTVFFHRERIRAMGCERYCWC